VNLTDLGNSPNKFESEVFVKKEIGRIRKRTYIQSA